MRIIGQLPTEESAKRFSDCLFVEGIVNSVEADGTGWSVWIHSEDELAKARDLLTAYQTNPNDPAYKGCSTKAADLRARAVEADKEVAPVFDRTRLFRRSLPYGMGVATILLAVICLGVALLSEFGKNGKIVEPLLMDGAAVAKGEVWRVLSPIFLHFGMLHLVFNLLWLLDLGSMIEGRQGTWRLMLLVLVIAVLSNLAQYYFSYPVFGGMSGVVYGLLGYVWMKGKFDPGSGLFLHSQTVVMMLIWFFACLLNFIPNVANTVHAVGLGVGLLWGSASAFSRRSA